MSYAPFSSCVFHRDKNIVEWGIVFYKDTFLVINRLYVITEFII